MMSSTTTPDHPETTTTLSTSSSDRPNINGSQYVIDDRLWPRHIIPYTPFFRLYQPTKCSVKPMVTLSQIHQADMISINLDIATYYNMLPTDEDRRAYRTELVTTLSRYRYTILDMFTLGDVEASDSVQYIIYQDILEALGIINGTSTIKHLSVTLNGRTIMKDILYKLDLQVDSLRSNVSMPYCRADVLVLDAHTIASAVFKWEAASIVSLFTSNRRVNYTINIDLRLMNTYRSNIETILEKINPRVVIINPLVYGSAKVGLRILEMCPRAVCVDIGTNFIRGHSSNNITHLRCDMQGIIPSSVKYFHGMGWLTVPRPYLQPIELHVYEQNLPLLNLSQVKSLRIDAWRKPEHSSINTRRIVQTDRIDISKIIATAPQIEHLGLFGTPMHVFQTPVTVSQKLKSLAITDATVVHGDFSQLKTLIIRNPQAVAAYVDKCPELTNIFMTRIYVSIFQHMAAITQLLSSPKLQYIELWFDSSCPVEIINDIVKACIVTPQVIVNDYRSSAVYQ